jgi:diguanylate cyclase (GGDEF)-like protein
MIKRVRPWWPYIEATVFIALAILVQERFFPGNPAYRDLPFSLLWVPILLIAGRYGTAPAVFTGFLAAGFYFYGVSLENFSLREFSFSRNDKVMLFSYIFVSIFIGQMYDRLRNQLFSLQHDHDDLKAQFNNLKQHHQSLQLVNEELEKRLVGRQATLSSLYEMARGLEKLDEKHLFQGLLELLVKFMHASKCCLFLKKENGSLVLAANQGYADDERALLETKGMENSLIQTALRGEFPLSFRGGHEEQARLPHPFRSLMASPIRLLTTGQTVGIITVDEMPFLAVNAGNLRILGIIADWAAQNIEKARAFKDLQARELDDQLTGVYSNGYFRIRIVEEMNRSQRHEVPFSLFLLKIRKYEEMNPENQKDLLAIFGLVFQRSLRGIDIVCRYNRPDTFVVILPMTEEGGLSILQEKLRFEIESYSFKPFDSDEVLSLHMAPATFRGFHGEKKVYSVNPAQIQGFLENLDRTLDQP